VFGAQWAVISNGGQSTVWLQDESYNNLLEDALRQIHKNNKTAASKSARRNSSWGRVSERSGEQMFGTHVSAS